MTAPRPILSIPMILTTLDLVDRGSDVLTILVERSGASADVVRRRLSHLADGEYIEFGATPNIAWLTPKGQSLLHQLRQEGRHGRKG